MVIYSVDVRNGILEYWRSLSRYPITRARAYEKYQDMRQALNALDKSIATRVCTFKDLGQIYNSSNQIVNKYLYMFVYTDKKAKSRWAFSYIYDEVNDIIFVYKMKYEKHIREWQDRLNKIISETLNRYLHKNIIK